MGEVYRATDSNLKRSVAIKVLPASVAGDADRLSRFQREAEVLAALNHPNIAAIYGFERTPEVSALVMELVDGEDLSVRIARLRAPGASARQAGIPLDDALPIAKQIAEALEAAHEQGIIHRDLKPANIKIRADGTVKVLDFGLAKALDANAPRAAAEAMNSPTLTVRATQAGMILGTAAYMAPEQARGKPVDRRADVWAFGVVLYELLSGRRAFEGDDISITLANVLKEDVDWDALPATVPSALRRLLRRCLEKDPKRRLQAIGEARIAIEELIAGAGNEIVNVAPAVPIGSNGLVWKIAAGTFAAAAIALGVVALRHFREPAPVREVVRFQIPSPDGTEPSAPSISPTGRHVAFRTVQPSTPGSGLIWVHSLESSTSWPLPGTEGLAGSPFWSPDGLYLVYRLGNKLLRVPVAGGRPQPIADFPGSFLGGSWGRAGVIVFGGDQGLMQVAEAGGSPAVLIPRDSSRSDGGFVAWPKFLPDGRHFVYASGSREVEFYLGSLDRAQAPKRLMAAPGANAISSYAPSSNPGLAYLLFARPGALMAQPFDTRSLATAGEAIRIDADIDAEMSPWMSSSATGVLAYQSGRPLRKYQLTWLDRKGKTLGTEASPGNLQALSLSRDGKRVAIERRDSGNADIWVIDLSRGTTTRVTTDAGDDTRAVLSPDGGRVAFTRAGSMYQKSASGAGDEERLGEGETVDWSPDGRFLCFQKNGDLWALPLFGERTPILIAGGTFTERRGRFSPDGKWIAFESNVSGRYEIYLQSFPPTSDHMQIVSVDGGDSPYWRGDGGELVFRAPDNRIMAVDITPGPTPAPSVPRVLLQLPADAGNGRFVAMPDGQRFLVPLELGRVRPQIMITLNWLETLDRRTTGVK